MQPATIEVRLTPRSGKNEIQRYERGVLHVRVAAPPVGGAANTALIELLSHVLHVPKTSIHIGSGTSSREKRVIVEGREAAAIDAFLDVYNLPVADVNDGNRSATS